MKTRQHHQALEVLKTDVVGGIGPCCYEPFFLAIEPIWGKIRSVYGFLFFEIVSLAQWGQKIHGYYLDCLFEG